MLRMFNGNLRERIETSSSVLIALAFALSGLMPIILSTQASAAQLTTRSVTLTSSAPGATGVSYAFAFSVPSTTAQPIRSILFEFCTTPLGTCTKPTGLNAGYTAASTNATQTFSQAPVFTEDTTGGGACNALAAGASTATQYCVSRTGGTSGTNETTGAKAITIDGITNPTIPSGNNVSMYIRIHTYSDSAYATAVDDGTVAASIVNQLTVTGRVQERLVFCVFALDDAAGSNTTTGTASTNMPTDCTAAEATASSNIDVGIVDNATIAVSPRDNTSTLQGNDRFGAAMVNTNATNGVAIAYYASAATSGTNELRAFRVPGATCNVSGTDLTDQCFVSASSSGETLVAGTERFGLQLACIDNSTTTSANTGGAIGTTSNLGKAAGSYNTTGGGTGGSVNAVYNAGRTTGFDDGSGNDCENGTTPALSAKYGWNATSTAAPLISSTTVVDDEMVKFRYGATASATTPTGTYTVASTYIATPSF